MSTPSSTSRCMRRSLQILTAFWGEQAKRLDWITAVHEGQEHQFSYGPMSRSNGLKTACSMSPPTASTGIWRRGAIRPRSFWSPTTPRRCRAPYHLSAVARAMCAGLPTCSRTSGVKKGDRVTIYMPMIPEAAYAMLACARIGAVHSVVFGGFSPDALAGRINDCDSRGGDHRRRGPARR